MPTCTEALDKNSFFSNQNAPIDIISSTNAGRLALSSLSIPASSHILSCPPFVISPFYSCRKELCMGCYTFTLDRLRFKCPGCPIWYCSRACRALTLSFHSHYECAYILGISKISEKWIDQVVQKTIADDRASKDSDRLKTLLSVYSKSDIQDLALWILNYIVRVHMESLVPLRESHLSQVQDLVSHYPHASADERMQLQFLYDLLSVIPFSQSITTSWQSLLFAAFPNGHLDFGHLLGIRQSNGFGLWDTAGECLGIGLYPFASYFNHSCSPNLVRSTGLVNRDHLKAEDVNARVQEKWRASGISMEELCVDLDQVIANPSILSPIQSFKHVYALLPRVSFQALHNLEPKTPLTHSYIDLTLPLHERKSMLLEGYDFECLCDRCKMDDGAYLAMYLCDCGYVRDPYRACLKCGRLAKVQ